MQTMHGMRDDRLNELLSRMGNVRFGMLGDVCLDVYWLADMQRSELSRETPHFPLPIIEERMSPGAGGNVAANAAALNPAQVSVISVVGGDWRGRELACAFEQMGVSTRWLIQSPGIFTNAYIKPLRKGISDLVYEDPRLDFAPLVPLSGELEDSLLASLDACCKDLDVLCVCDQFHNGVVTGRVRQKLQAYSDQGLLVVVDSRESAGLYRNVILKPNYYEAVRALGWTDGRRCGPDTASTAASALSRQTESKVFMTLGDQGSLLFDGYEAWHVPAHPVEGPIDFCGAGDSSLAGFALALGAGASQEEAAYFAGLCSEVTIRQVGVTGTASRQQILDWNGRISPMGSE